MKYSVLCAFVVSVVLAFFLFIIAPHTYAQSNPYYNTTQTGQADSSDSSLPTQQQQEDLHVYTQSVLIEVLTAVTCQISGVDLTRTDGRCIGIDPTTKKLGYVNQNGGAIGFMGGMIASTYNIPISSGQYIADLSDNFGVVKHTYAASCGAVSCGTGFNSLRPFLPLWKTFRNLVYLMFVLLFVVVGLAIMLRLKIDPRTVMTLQNQLPKIVIGLILVSFSYAIAGFLIDLMWLSCYLMFNVVSQASPHLNISSMNPTSLANGTPFNAIGGIGGLGGIAKDSAGGIGNVISSIFEGTMGRVVGGIVMAILGSSIGSTFGSGIPFIGGAAGLIGGVLGGVIGIVGGSKLLGLFGAIIGFLVICIAIIISLFKLWWRLLQAYIFLLLDIILGPIWIAAAILPGSPLGFGKWIRSVAANLAAFPAAITMLMLGKALMDSVGRVQIHDQFVPPLIGNPGQPNAIASILGLGVILLTPEVVNIAKDVFKAPQNKYAPAAMKGAAAGATGLRMAASPFMGALLRRNRQTGVAEGPLGYLLGRNALFRSLFRTENPYTNRPGGLGARPPGRLGRIGGGIRRWLGMP